MYQLSFAGKQIVITEEDIQKASSEPETCFKGTENYEESLFYAITEGPSSPFTASERDTMGINWNKIRESIIEIE